MDKTLHEPYGCDCANKFLKKNNCLVQYRGNKVHVCQSLPLKTWYICWLMGWPYAAISVQRLDLLRTFKQKTGIHVDDYIYTSFLTTSSPCTVLHIQAIHYTKSICDKCALYNVSINYVESSLLVHFDTLIQTDTKCWVRRSFDKVRCYHCYDAMLFSSR